MFEARLEHAGTFKKLLDAVKDLVKDANFECSSSGIVLQAMDSAHVSLVTLLLRSEGFEHYRCDRNVSLGLNLDILGKVLKCANNDDVMTIKADDAGDSLTIMFESKNADKLSDFSVKLMDIESESLGIPETDYSAVVKMPAGEFQRVCGNLSVLGDAVAIKCSKDAISFAVSDDSTSVNIAIKPTSTVDVDESEQTTIELQDEVNLTFALRYLSFFTKATGLANQVSLSMSSDVPLVVEYRIDQLGYIRYYLAPKIEDE